MMRWTLVLALLALGGCEEKKDTAAAPSAAAPVSGAATAPSGAPASGTAATPSGATPSGAAASGTAATPSGATASGAAATPSGAAASGRGAKPAATASGAKAAPQPSGMMPHGSVEEGTLKYNPPPAQNPSGATTKKAPAKP